MHWYKEFLRGQNHYDTYLLSGVSGTAPAASIARKKRCKIAPAASRIGETDRDDRGGAQTGDPKNSSPGQTDLGGATRVNGPR